MFCFFFKQKTAYEMRISDWSSDVCSSDLVIESMLYSLWDLRLKVGHSSRSIDETMRMAREDLTIRTALLEGRYIWGDQTVYGEVSSRFDKEVVKDTAQIGRAHV